MHISKKLQKSYPFVKEKIWGECFVCISEGNGDRLKENVNYEVEYVGEGCDYVYYGETCRNGMFCVGVKSAWKTSVRKIEKMYLLNMRWINTTVSLGTERQKDSKWQYKNHIEMRLNAWPLRRSKLETVSDH